MQGEMKRIDYQMAAPAHAYRHPKTPGEAWHRPEEAAAKEKK
jgi:hypothetical protein